MSVMDMIRKWKENKARTGEKYKELEENAKIERILSERSKSANKRELEKFYKDQEEKQIADALKKIHDKQNKDNWKGSYLNGKYMFKDDRPILKEKNIFVDNKNKVPIQTKDKGMFFRW